MNIVEYIEGPFLSFALKQAESIIKVESDILDASIYNKIYRELFNEAKAMFHIYINTYYSYRTKSYSRHGTGIGTGTGISLYAVQNFSLEEMSPGKELPKLVLNTDSSALPGYKHDSNDTVWDIIVNGGRGLPGKRGYQSWAAAYNGPLFSSQGTLQGAIDNLTNRQKDIADLNFDKYVTPEIIQEIAKRIAQGVISQMVNQIKVDIHKGVITFG